MGQCSNAEHKMIQDMTKGDPLKLVLWFSVPLLIGNIFQQLYNLADIVIVGRLIGLNSLAAVGSTAPLFFMVMFILVGLTNGFAIVTGQRFGAKDFDGVRKSVGTSLILSFGFTFIFTIFVLLSLEKILILMNVPFEIFRESYDYLYIIIWGMWSTNLYNLLSSIIRALGDSKTPLYVLIIASILNVILAIVLISKFGLGVKGAAAAVVVSQAVSSFLCILCIAKRFPVLHLKKEDLKLNKNFVLYHLKIGVPMAIQFSVLGMSMLIVQAVCNTFGPEVIGAFTYALRIEQIAIMPLASLAIAITAYTAQNFGALNFSRIRQGVGKISLVSFILSVLMAIILRIWGTDIISFFAGNTHPNVISIAHQYLNISTTFYIFIGQLFVFRNTLQGMGDAIVPFFASLSELGLRSYAAIVLAAKFGYVGIFYAGPIAWVGSATIVSLGYFATLKNTVKKTRARMQEARKAEALCEVYNDGTSRNIP